MEPSTIRKLPSTGVPVCCIIVPAISPKSLSDLRHHDAVVHSHLRAGMTQAQLPGNMSLWGFHLRTQT